MEISGSLADEGSGLKDPTCKCWVKGKREEDDDDERPLRPMFCLKNDINMKQIEEREDCFILDFDPYDSVDIAKLAVTEHVGDDEVSVLAEKGQVACRDYPHSRHLCLQFPFETTPHEDHCHLCYCYVCDSAAPCEKWSTHCHATAHVEGWDFERKAKRSQTARPKIS